MVVLSVANTVNMSVFERISEFGTLKALGNRNTDIFRLIVLECALIGLIGSLAGVVTGLVVASGVSALGIVMPPLPNSNTGYVVTIRTMTSGVAVAFGVGVCATLFAAIRPALRIAKSPISESLKQS